MVTPKFKPGDILYHKSDEYKKPILEVIEINKDRYHLKWLNSFNNDNLYLIKGEDECCEFLYNKFEKQFNDEMKEIINENT